MTLKKEIVRKILEEYRPLFPGWKVHGKITLYRCHGPIVQGVCLDRSSSDDYRPMFFNCELLRSRDDKDFPLIFSSEILIKGHKMGWFVDIRAHEREKPNVMRDMQEQIRPQINESLEVDRVLQVCKERVAKLGNRGPTVHQAASLAAMEAWCDQNKSALKYIAKCKKDLSAHTQERGTLYEWCAELLAYVITLERWLDEGTARQHLGEIVAAEKKRYGIEDTE